MSESPAIVSSPARPLLRLRFLRIPLLLAGCIACGFGIWFWRESLRPGMRHYQKGIDAMEAHHAGVAEQEWLSGIREDPAFMPCYEQLGDLYTVLLRYPEAADNYKHAVKLAPDDGSLYVRLARMEHMIGNNEESYQAAKRAYELLPNEADAVGGYGILEAERKNPTAALVALRRAHALEPNNHVYLEALAKVELDNLDYASVERDLPIYLQKHPDDAEFNYMMAVVYNQKPRTPPNIQTALQYAQKTLPAMEKDERAYSILGQLYLDANEPKDALNCYLAGHDRIPNSENMLHGMVDCYARLGDASHSAAAASEFQKLTARHDRIQHLKHVMGFNNNDIPSALELAKLQEEDTKLPLARSIYDKLVEQFPQNDRIKAARAAFYQRVGIPLPSSTNKIPQQ